MSEPEEDEEDYRDEPCPKCGGQRVKVTAYDDGEVDGHFFIDMQYLCLDCKWEEWD